jgi:hypothetical protein
MFVTDCQNFYDGLVEYHEHLGLDEGTEKEDELRERFRTEMDQYMWTIKDIVQREVEPFQESEDISSMLTEEFNDCIRRFNKCYSELEKCTTPQCKSYEMREIARKRAHMIRTIAELAMFRMFK